MDVYQSLSEHVWRTGLEIMDVIEQEKDSTISFGSLYPILHRLEIKGYAQARWRDEPEERLVSWRR